MAARCRRIAPTRDAAESAKVDINVKHWCGVGGRTGIIHFVGLQLQVASAATAVLRRSLDVYVDNLNIFPYLKIKVHPCYM